MKNLLIYVNLEKDLTGEYLDKIESVISARNLRCEVIRDGEEPSGTHYDALIVLGGDGTILRRTELANRLNLPILGINCGELGFLSEFEFSEAATAVDLLESGKLVKDERTTLKITFGGKTFYALNDAVLSRMYEENKRIIVNVGLKIGEIDLQPVIGDGVIISTPTGSTAYSMSAGGAILEPNIDAFCVTPIAAHSLTARCMVFSSETRCRLKLGNGANAGLFADGNRIAILKDGDEVFISKAEKNTVFLRKSGFDFFRRINKFQGR